MRMRSVSETFPLTYDGIDAVSEQLETWLTNMRVERRNRLLIRLAMEEALLRMIGHIQVDSEYATDGTVRMSAGVNLAGSYVCMEHEGTVFNPLSGELLPPDGWSSSLFNSMGMRPQYAYVGNNNVLRISFARRGLNPALSLVIGLVLGSVVGIVGDVLMPDSVQAAIVNTVGEPIFEMWTRMLNAIAGPVIFFMVITTMLNTHKVEENGGNKMTLVARYFIICFIMGLSSVAASVLLFNPQFASDVWGLPDTSSVLKDLANVVPRHILEPFSTSNTPQLMLLAFVLGNAIIALGERADNVAGFVRQMNMACSLVTAWVSALVPVLAGLLLAFEIWIHQVSILSQIWKPSILGLVVSLSFFGMEMWHVHHHLSVKMRTLIQKIQKPFMTTVRAGTLDASYGDAEYSCNKLLGIDPTFTNVVLPQGLVLYMPASIIGTLAFTVFNANGFGVNISLWWCVLAAALDVLLFVATPPVPGANLLAFITLFQMLGISKDALLDAMIFDIVFGLFANGANQAFLQIEMVLQANRLGLVDRRLLCSEPSEIGDKS